MHQHLPHLDGAGHPLPAAGDEVKHLDSVGKPDLAAADDINLVVGDAIGVELVADG